MADTTPLMLIELHISCKNLRDVDLMSKSDPFVLVHIATPTDHTMPKFAEIGSTEVQSNNLNPTFKKPIQCEYLFEVKQLLRFEIYDCDDEKNLHRLEKHDALGFVETDMPFLMGKRGNATFEIKNGRGTLTVKVVELGSGESNESVELRVVGDKLKKMDVFSKSDPYLKISRVLPSGDKNMLHKTEVIKNNLNPEWSKFQLSVGHLCGGNKSQKCICIECWDWDSGSKHDSMGEALVSVEQLVAGDTVELRKPHKPDKLYGVLCFRGTRVFKVPTFFDYIKGGVALSLAVSIDFTASNNDPRRPDSLHYMNPNAPNHYAHAIMSVGDVLKGYVTDERFSVFGFGAILPYQNTPNHMFPLTFNPQNPYVTGVQEILNVYGHALTQARLSGPTNFAPSIRAVTAAARQRTFTYTIHLIITDGEITDMQDTIDALVEAATAPLSIIIIGVGTECDFQCMNVLDGDKNKLQSRGGTFSQRDIVQFVPMRNFASAPQHVLAREVLREVPKQFLLWAKLANFECPY